MIAGDDVRLNYADTYFGKPRQTQAAKLLDGLQASGRRRDDGTGRFGFRGCPSPLIAGRQKPFGFRTRGRINEFRDRNLSGTRPDRLPPAQEPSDGAGQIEIALWAYLSTRRGTPCQAPAVKGKRRCRMHGGAEGSGAPRGNRNALKHGYYTADAIAERRLLRQLINGWHDSLAKF